MPATEDLLGPIHKGIRSMIYTLGTQLQSTDFSDATAANRVLDQMYHEFSAATSTGCILCLLHSHAGDEEGGVLPAARAFEPALVEALLREHHEILQRLVRIGRMADEIRQAPTPEERVRHGVVLNREANSFFAYYLVHMNREEEQLTPAMQAHMTDDQLRALRAKVQAGMDRQRLATFMEWVLPSLNVNELAGMFAGLRRGAPPEQLAFMTGIAAAHVPPERWAEARARAGL